MDSWLIGSASDCDIVVAQEFVSGHHCRLSRTADRFELEDLHSSNGTFVNGERISEVVQVSPNDRITLSRKIDFPWPNLAFESAPTEIPISEIPRSTTRRIIRIGREADNDLILDYPMISGHHARVLIEADQVVIEDLGSTNGTHIGSLNHPIRRVALANDDIVYFGSFRTTARRILAYEGDEEYDPRASLHQIDREVTVGRDPSCDQVLDFPMVSWRHAKICTTTDGLTVEDLGSTNGTYVNGRRINGIKPLRSGDVVALGTYTFTVTDAGVLERRDYRGNITIEAKNLCVDVPDAQLLADVSLTIYPSEFAGLMGPSGAGKTTLINALNGYSEPSSGQVFCNGHDLYANYDRFRGHIGYVPQDDIIHGDLTVGQALYYSARLRLPNDFTDKEIAKRIDTVLDQLGLSGTQDVLIGSPQNKGISGGQRKRVNLAMELLTDPSVLFLDEPTSGLSSEDALMVMKVLRSLADDGKTILLTIHQPSAEVFRLMDNLVVVGKDPQAIQPGRLAYYGPAYPDAIHFFNPDQATDADERDPSPDEALRGLAKRPMDDWLIRYAKSEYHQRFVSERRSESSTVGVSIASPNARAAGHRTAGITQWSTLARRCLAISRRDTWNSALLLAQAPIIAILIVLVFGKQASQDVAFSLPAIAAPITTEKLADARQQIQDNSQQWHATAKATSTMIFLMALSALWFGCSNSARAIVSEWSIYRRERMVNLKIPSYIASKYTVFGTLCVVQCLVLLTVVHWGGGLQGEWVRMFAVLLLASIVGVGIGLTVSSVARNSEVAIATLPIVILPMVILGGVLQPIHEMGTASEWFCQAMPSRWAFESLLVIEADQRPEQPEQTLPMVDPRSHGKTSGGPHRVADTTALQEGHSGDAARRSETQPTRIDMAEAFFPKQTDRMGVCTSSLALLAMLILLTGATWRILRVRDLH